MGPKRKPVPGVDRLRVFPYYKIQIWNGQIGAWKDVQRAFESLDVIFEFASEKLGRDKTTRIMIVESERVRKVEERFNAFGKTPT